MSVMRPSSVCSPAKGPSTGAPARPSARSCQGTLRSSCLPDGQECQVRHCEGDFRTANATPIHCSDSAWTASSASHVTTWHEYANRLDIQQRRLDMLLESRDSAVAEEDFFAAAAFAGQAEELQATDSLRRLRQAQADAIAEQDYTKAAQIYQSRLGTLCGWWQVSPGQADVWGHVLHVTEQFGKLTGRAYSAADLVKLFGCTPNNQMRASLNKDMLSSVGETVFEVYIAAPDSQTDGVQHQAFFLDDSVNSGFTSDSITANLFPGSTRAARSPGGVRSRARSQLRSHLESGQPSYSPPPAPRRCSTPESGTRRRSLTPRRRPTGRATAHRRPFLVPRSARRSQSEPPPGPTPGLDSARAALERSLALPLPGSGRTTTAAACASVDSGDDATYSDAASPPRLTPDPMVAPVDSDPTHVDAGRDLNSAVHAPESSSSALSEDSALAAIQPHSDATQGSAAEPRVDSEECAPHAVRSDSKQARAGGRVWERREHSSSPPSSPSALQGVDEIAGAQVSSGSAPPASSADGVRGRVKLQRHRGFDPAARTPASVTCDSDGATLRVCLPPTALPQHRGGGSTGEASTTPQLAYRRMDASGGGDPLAGYFLGSYGSHGDELLYLQRGLWQGREAIIAHKVTGDLYVPAGQVSFRVHTDAPNMKVMYSAMLGADVALAGEGCSWADGGAPDADGSGASWLPGDLVQLGVHKAPMLADIAGGADLGFVWTGAYHRQFLILLTRLTFDT